MTRVLSKGRRLVHSIKRVPGLRKHVTALETEQQRLLGLINEQHQHILDLRKELKLQKTWIVPGHFYSPLTSDTNFKKFTRRKHIPGIDLHTKDQLKLLKKFAAYYKQQPFKDNKSKENRYYFNNDQFGYSDAFSLFCMLMHFKPKRVVEVGSGYSSALMLDTNNKFLNNSMKLTFIEPYPKRLKSVLTKSDKPKIIQKFVQDVPLSTFKNLSAGDILFIDSSHVAKSGSDVNWLYHEVLPIIKPGVIVHVHDIMYPFEYIDEWIQQGRSWNEIYMLRCLLTESPNYKIIFWANYLHKFYKKEMSTSMPLSTKNAGGSIWFVKQ
jgi:predicted O-methyltransferase YrrM